MFHDRLQAARLLAERLHPYRGRRPLVLGVPRAAVPMARLVAEELDGELDVVLAHPLRRGAGGYAGSVDEWGQVHPRDLLDSELRGEIEAQLSRLRNLRRYLSTGRPAKEPWRRAVIVVDDVASTGATMRAALRATRARDPARLIAAVAVATPGAARLLGAEANELVCLETPPPWTRAGELFETSELVTDGEVVRILADVQAPSV